MIFVDTNVFMYVVGRPHPLREHARQFFTDALRDQSRLCTSAEVVQELLHAYIAPGRMKTLDAALSLIESTRTEVWPLEMEDVTLARQLQERLPALSARDLCHLASCRRRGVHELMTFDQALGGVSV